MVVKSCLHGWEGLDGKPKGFKLEDSEVRGTEEGELKTAAFLVSFQRSPQIWCPVGAVTMHSVFFGALCHQPD